MVAWPSTASWSAAGGAAGGGDCGGDVTGVEAGLDTPEAAGVAGVAETVTTSLSAVAGGLKEVYRPL